MASSPYPYLGGAVQFNLSSLQGLTITSAQLNLGLAGYSGSGLPPTTASFNVAVSAYSGTGTVALSDFSLPLAPTLGKFPQTVIYNNGNLSGSVTPISQNVTSVLQSEIAQGVQFGGFILVPTDVTITGYVFQDSVSFDVRDATLTVTVATVPEPSSLALLGAASAIFAGYSRWRGLKRGAA